jgi:hypothetical protein
MDFFSHTEPKSKPPKVNVATRNAEYFSSLKSSPQGKFALLFDTL